eukprot:scaffold788_cov231-Pinguiococcus_pyrenoidosus.AAC.10
MAFATETKIVQDARLDTTQTVADIFATMEAARTEWALPLTSFRKPWRRAGSAPDVPPGPDR